MSCPSFDRLAAAASGDDALAMVHAEVCERCRELLAEQTAIVALAKRLPAPPLVGARRRTLEALVYAQVDGEPTVPRARWKAYAPIALGLAAAAAVAIIAIGGRRAPPVVRAPEPMPAQRQVPTPKPAPPAPAPAPIAPDLVATDADYVRDRQTVQLRAGALAIDTRGQPALDVTSAGAAVHVGDAKVEIVARRGAIAMVRVFAGSAEVTLGGKRVVVATGDVWVPEPAKPPPARVEAAPVSPAAPVEPAVAPPAVDEVERSLAEFRTGWTALRAGRNADAIAAFDRATDPVVAEDAAYWAAVASERAGDRAGAARRFRGFLDRFPSSPRADGARARLGR